ncbi:MAG TPA: hypothetical protein VFQ92_22905 [Blastocatellia bacterium]|nr:hypothetical protein [Blastocatellia bacterium]
MTVREEESLRILLCAAPSINKKSEARSLKLVENVFGLLLLGLNRDITPKLLASGF